MHNSSPPRARLSRRAPHHPCAPGSAPQQPTHGLVRPLLDRVPTPVWVAALGSAIALLGVGVVPGSPIAASWPPIALALVLLAWSWRTSVFLQQEIASSREWAEGLERSNGELRAFVREVSHDLKAPLVTATGFLRMARDVIDEGDSERAVELLDRSAATATRMDAMISDLLGRAEATWSPGLSDIDLNAEVREAMADLTPRLAAAGVALDVDSDLGFVQGDPVRVRQAVANLVSNALKYGTDTSKPRVEIRSKLTGRGRELLVIDHGRGIAAEDRNRVFGAHTRLDSDRQSAVEGHGIGLSLVQRAMESMGGDATIRATTGGGATFALQFPAPRGIPVAA